MTAMTKLYGTVVNKTENCAPPLESPCCGHPQGGITTTSVTLAVNGYSVQEGVSVGMVGGGQLGSVYLTMESSYLFNALRAGDRVALNIEKLPEPGSTPKATE